MSDAAPRSAYAPERQQAILAEATVRGRVEVSALAERFGVTPETIRRDLASLERLGAVRRVHGGALPLQPAGFELALSDRQDLLTTQKRRIAERALAELPEGGTVLLDSGTTTFALAAVLPPQRSLTVLTNSVSIAGLLLSKPAVDLYMIGGRVREQTGAAVGQWARQALDGTSIDVAFLGTNGFSARVGMTTPDQAEAEVKRAMVAAGRRVVVLADSSKAGHDSFHRFARLREVDVLITDDGLDPATVDEVAAAGPQVVCA